MMAGNKLPGKKEKIHTSKDQNRRMKTISLPQHMVMYSSLTWMDIPHPNELFYLLSHDCKKKSKQGDAKMEKHNALYIDS
uniref:Uncharacterized protein n=1 Tax=Arundo donax TaxID=35708 RepID=A0A0A9GJ03_ARUDO